MTELIFEIRRHHEYHGEGLWLFVNGGMSRGWKQEDIIKHNLSEDDIIEEFKAEVALFEGKLAE